MTRMSPFLTLFAACSSAVSEHDIAVSAQTLELSVCSDGDMVPGVDVSYWQDTIDWDAVAASGIQFAFIRVSDGTGFLDPEFETNWAAAREVGIVRGAYQFFRPGQDAIAQADLLLEEMGALLPDDLPPVVDVEDSDGESPETVAAQLGLWIDTVEAAIGRAPIIYTARYYWNDEVVTDDFADYPLWVANWGPACPNLPDAWSEWVFWQDSSTGSVPGIYGNVDTNWFNGSYDQLLEYAGGGSAVECGDARCNGGETADSCALDCRPCWVLPADGAVIDDVDPCFRAGGPSDYIRNETTGYGGSLKWTHTTDDSIEYNYGEWTLFFGEAGQYKLDVYTDGAFSQSRAAVYLVDHGEDTTAVTLDQTAVNGWQTLGDFEFVRGGRNQSVHVGDNTGEPLEDGVQLVFDALRLTRIDASAPDAGPGDDPSTDAGGEVKGGLTESDSDADVGLDDPSGQGEGGCRVGGQSDLALESLLLISFFILGRRRRRSVRNRTRG